MAQGMSEAEAEEAAVREMGDPVEAGVQLDRIHRPKMDMRLIAMIVMLGISGVAIQVFLERTAILCGAGDYLAASYDPAGLRFILWTAAGSILMLGVCFVDYTLLGKYALRIWAAMMMMMAVYRVFGRTVNGMYPKQGLFYCVLVPVFAGVVFHFRGAGKQGMMKCILILVLSTVLPLVLNSSVYMILFYMTGGCILILAVHKRWFGKEKKRQYILMAGTTVLLPVGILGIMMSAGQVFLAAYQSDRLKQIFRFQSSENCLYQIVLENLKNAADAVAGREGLIIDESTNMVWSEVRSDYVWVFIFKVLGTWQGILFTLALAGFLGVLIWIVRKQKNQLGYVVGMACVLMMIAEILVYLGTNSGVFYPVSVYMPFFSYGGSNMMVTYLYMGILLSITRNQNVVKAG